MIQLNLFLLVLTWLIKGDHCEKAVTAMPSQVEICTSVMRFESGRPGRLVL